MNNIEVIVLAAGKGTRMESALPKVLVPLRGRPMVSYVLNTLSSLDVSPVLVVGYEAGRVKETLGEKYRYVLQEEQLGTGHAVKIVESSVKEARSVVVLYGDHPLVSAETITKLIALKEQSASPLVMATTEVPDFNDWRRAFRRFGRVIRDRERAVERIVEAKDASDEELSVREVNPAYFCFDRAWLFKRLSTLSNNNAQGEYYLTDLVKCAFDEGHIIETCLIDAHEALGANTKEELEVFARFL